jgi:hypothetical protein
MRVSYAQQISCAVPGGGYRLKLNPYSLRGSPGFLFSPFCASPMGLN